LDDLLALPSKIPKNVAALGSFVFNAISPVKSFANKRFEGEDARALFGGCAAHSMLPLNKHLTTGYATVMLILAHTFGWPFPRGGAQKLADALAAYLASLGGRIETGFNVTTLDSLPRAKAIFLDVTPKQALGILGSSLPMWYTRSLGSFRYGPGVFKVDYALDGPIPWKAEECLGAGTVHVGGSLKEIAISEEEVSRGIVPERPFIILAQQSLFDDSRAPDGKQALWAYCHAPSGSNFDLSKRIEAQIERFAPGFTRRILKKHSLSAVELERYNANYVGGDINGGVQDLWQTISRPVLSLCPYRTPLRGVYLCSSSTPPGGGVHGMCGYLAAKAALSREFAIS
jgi:phytoene dehydrogenase-like protein